MLIEPTTAQICSRQRTSHGWHTLVASSTSRTWCLVHTSNAKPSPNFWCSPPRLLSWLDGVSAISYFDHEADNITSTVKVRQADFGDALDTETRLPELFDELVEQKVLPPMRSHR